MAKKNTKKHSSRTKHHNKPESYKQGLLAIDDVEVKYDELFDKKLAAQYREFRNFKEHSLQVKKFIRILAVLITLIVLALLLINFG